MNVPPSTRIILKETPLAVKVCPGKSVGDGLLGLGFGTVVVEVVVVVVVLRLMMTSCACTAKDDSTNTAALNNFLMCIVFIMSIVVLSAIENFLFADFQESLQKYKVSGK